MTPPDPRDRLPEAARARVAAIKASGTWDSALSTGEFAAIEAAGFKPVGQVFGAAVYKVGFPGGTVCPTYGGGSPPRGFNGQQAAVLRTGREVFGPLVDVAYKARRSAIERMMAECSVLCGHGVVGVSLNVDQFHGHSDALECTAIGTAIRVRGDLRLPAGVRLKAPFTAVVSGQEFAKLIMGGFVPVRVVFGISIGVNHDDWLRDRLARGLARKLADSVEISSYTNLVNWTRQDARKELRLHVARSGGQGVLLQRTDLRIGEYECPGLPGDRDHWAEVTMTGTAIVGIAQKRQRPPDRPRPARRAEQRPSVAVLSLDPERRRAARARAGSPAVTAPGTGRSREHDRQGIIDNAPEEQE